MASAAPTTASAASAGSSSARADPSSFANIDEVCSKHVDIAWTVDFDTKTLSGSVTITAEVVKAGAATLVLDSTSSIEISSAEVGVQGEAAKAVDVAVGTAHKALGIPLTLPLPSGLAKGAKVVATIVYKTAPGASALQWLTKEQTADKTHPYLFSQCQAIHARSMMPCQDSPGAKFTYAAKVTVPEGLTALMSALSDGQSDASAGSVEFSFKQPVAIPSYLVALAVGRLESRDVGPRSKVWAEPSVVEAAANEFADTESFIAEGEKLLSKYVWTRYDVLCMPPSFPYGGMENPCLTFVTPTLLAGDRSLADVICHEIAHSWTGNLVTTRNWEHFWLNEGCTMWVQRKIMQKLHGAAFFDFDAMIGLKMLQDDVEHLGATNPLTALVPKLADVDPDDAFSGVPYEKGFLFHYYLQTVAGGPAEYDPWFKSYIDEFAHKAITSVEFKDFYLAHFSKKVDTSVIDWDTWFNKPGLPDWRPKYDMSLRDAAEGLAAMWLAGGADVTDAAAWTSLTTTQRISMLEVLLAAQAAKKADDKLTSDHTALARMDELYGLTASGNAEIRFRWQTLCLRAGYEAIVPAVVSFITEQGRMKFVRPLYRDLFKSSFGKATAVETFKANQQNLHPIAQKMVSTDLGLRSKSG